MFSRFAQVAIVVSAMFLALAMPATAGEKMSGVITSVEPDDHVFVITVGDQKHEFRLMLTAPVQVDGTDADVYKLKEGQKVEVTFEKEDGKNKATEVQATSE